MKEIIYKSEIMHQLMRMVERVAPSNAAVLILGETGTGKELIANTIHDMSRRRLRPFVSINCGALRETLLESELFGHEKGAFTGAYSRKIGLVEVANGGTLFLDEIGELTPGVQAKILRFLQEGEFYRVGGKDPIRADVRIITSTNKDLDKEVLRGNFREDLYYRINTIMMNVPALNKRKEDILLLTQTFCKCVISDEVSKILTNYSWPGNVRELKNTCERLNVLCDKMFVQVSDLPEHIRNPDTQTISVDYDPKLTLYEMERRQVLKALKYFEGNKTQAAEALGITLKTLYNKLHEYGEFEKYSR